MGDRRTMEDSTTSVDDSISTGADIGTMHDGWKRQQQQHDSSTDKQGSPKKCDDSRGLPKHCGHVSPTTARTTTRGASIGTTDDGWKRQQHDSSTDKQGLPKCDERGLPKQCGHVSPTTSTSTTTTRGGFDIIHVPPQTNTPLAPAPATAAAAAAVPTTDQIEGVARHLDRFLSMARLSDGAAGAHTGGSRFRKGVVGFLKSATKSSGEKLKGGPGGPKARGHRRKWSSGGRGGSEGDSSTVGGGSGSVGSKELRVSWGNTTTAHRRSRSNSDDCSSPVVVDTTDGGGCAKSGATALGSSGRSDEYQRHGGDEAPLGSTRSSESKSPLSLAKQRRKNDTKSSKQLIENNAHRDGDYHVTHQRAKSDTTTIVGECRSHRKQRSFELFTLPEQRARLKSVDSYFLSGGPKKGGSDSAALQGAGGRTTQTQTQTTTRWSTEQRSWSFLHKIDLEGRYVDDTRPDEQISALSQMLMRNTAIRELNLSWNMISDDSAYSIAAFLGANTSLERLDLSKNWKMGFEGGTALARALGKNETLQFLSLMNCKKVGTKTADAFATVLVKNTGLTDLRLGDCRIEPSGIVSIAAALSVNTTLVSINLSHNEIGLEGSRELAAALTINASLRSVDIRACDIGDAGARLFGAALAYNSTLEAFYLCRNDIQTPGVTALASTLTEEKNTTLTVLDLSDNYFAPGLLATIDDRLTKNRERQRRAVLHVSLTADSQLNSASFGDSSVIDGTAAAPAPAAAADDDAIAEGRDIMRQTSSRVGSSSSSSLGVPPLPIPLEYLTSCTDNFSGDRRLGQGAYGEVFLGIDKTLRRRFAVKRMKMVTFVDNDDAARARKVFKRELEAFKCFRHPNIARLNAFFLSDNLQGAQCLVFELATNGALDSFFKSISSRRTLDWTKRLKIAAGIANALKYLHHGDAAHFGSCFHGDIKPHNVCLKKDFTPLLIDCGLSCVLPTDESDMTQSIYGSSGKHTRGTVGYIDPQYAEDFAFGRNRPYTGACDIYSFGVVLAELFTGALQRSKVDGEEFHIFDNFSEDGRLKRNLEADADVHAGPWQSEHRRKFAGLAVECIRKDPERRPGISDVEERLSSLFSSAKPWTSGQRNSLAFLFSNPLAWVDNEGSLHPVTKLATNVEMDLVQQCVRDSKRDIKLSFDAATCSRLQELVSARYGCLHFAGHGMPCSTLVFEDGRSGCEFVSATDLSGLLPHREPFKFVFVAACHSEFIGKAFVDAGVKHVLCCEHESELLDDASATFTRSFYGALCNGYTIKHAFEAGMGAVTVRHTVKESKKFMLLPECEDHDVPVFNAAELEWEEERTSQRRVSSPVVFEGREVAMNQAISTILSRRRLVTLVGKSGVGRSSLAHAIASYIEDRLRGIRHIDNIVYVKRREGATDLEGSLVRPLLEQLVSAGLACEEKALKSRDSLQFVCRAVSEVKALIIFDDLDGIEETAKRLLQVLYEKASKVQVLCLAQRPINLISGVVIEKCVKVGPLDLPSSAKLFGKVCPLADTGLKRERISSSLLSRESSSGSTAPRNKSEEIVNVVHAGFPTDIIKAAKSVSEDDFNDLSLGENQSSGSLSE